MLDKLNKALADQKAKENKEEADVVKHIEKKGKFEQEYRVTELTVIHPTFTKALRAFKEKDYVAYFIRSKEEISKEIGDFPDGSALSVEMYGGTYYVFTHPDYNEQKVTIETKYGSIETKEHYPIKDISADLLDEIITNGFETIVSNYG